MGNRAIITAVGLALGVMALLLLAGSGPLAVAGAVEPGGDLSSSGWNSTRAPDPRAAAPVSPVQPAGPPGEIHALAPEEKAEPVYLLLIITPAEFRPALEPLVQHKNSTGISTTMITLGEIYRDPRFAGSDEPEEIKRAIAYYEDTHDVEYVMLVGDVNKFPVRWQMGHIFDGNDLFPDTPYHVYVPSDYYYADLYHTYTWEFNDWDPDGDRYYGEIYLDDVNPDDIDPYADLAVARVPAADITQLETYVRKVIRYEYTAHGSDWFDNLLLIHKEFSDWIDFKEHITVYLGDFDVTRLYEDIDPVDYSGPIDGLPTAANISAALNEGHGLMDQLWHGNYDAWLGMYDIGNIRTDLTNEFELPVIYSGACDTAKFALTAPFVISYTAESGLDIAPVADLGSAPGPGEGGIFPRPAPIQSRYNRYSLGEAFLLESDSGAIAYYGSQETGEHMHRMLERSFFQAYSWGDTILGDMWTYANYRFGSDYDLEHVVASHRDDGKWHWVPMALWASPSRFILFGDPSLRVGGVEGLEDSVPIVTIDDTDGEWHNEDVVVTLTATDYGSPSSPPSGICDTLVRVDGGGWEVGSHFTVEAPSDHSNDGVHDIEYYSTDMLGNTESPVRTAEVKIDTVEPSTTVLLNGALPATVACACPLGMSCDCDTCYYDAEVTVSFDATDALSGVEFTEYARLGRRLPACVYGLCTYSGPFTLGGGTHNLVYWSTDYAGNEETPTHRVTFCVNPAWGMGLLDDDIRHLAALKEIVAFRMRKDFVSTLPPIKAIAYEWALQSQPGQWTLIATDSYGDDGWGVDWNTAAVADGDYDVRLTVWGFPKAGVTGVRQPQDPVIYQEQLGATVVNISDSTYQFILYAADEVAAGQPVEYTLEFINKMGYTLTNLNLTCDTDAGFFDQIGVQDGGSLNPEGMPAWSRSSLPSGDSWKVHFVGWTRADSHPGLVIASQALLTAQTVPQLLSDDPSTPQDGDLTAVQIQLLNGAIVGQVEDEKYGAAISASVTIDGPVVQTVATDVNGSYAFVNLPPGAYDVSVSAEGYTYRTPAGPATVTLEGSGDSAQVDFFMRPPDTRPPYSLILVSVDDLVQGSALALVGLAHDHVPGSGVDRVELSIACTSDGTYWSGNGWVPAATWLLASGTGQWGYDTSGISWQADRSYAIKSRATDGAGNVETPLVVTTTPADVILLSPAHGTTTFDRVPSFDWSDVPDSLYILQVDDDPGFSSPEIHPPFFLGDSAYTPTNYLSAGTYYWRVKAVSSGNVEGDWSQVWMVTILQRIHLPLVRRGFQQ